VFMEPQRTPSQGRAFFARRVAGEARAKRLYRRATQCQRTRAPHTVSFRAARSGAEHRPLHLVRCTGGGWGGVQFFAARILRGFLSTVFHIYGLLYVVRGPALWPEAARELFCARGERGAGSRADARQGRSEAKDWPGRARTHGVGSQRATCRAKRAPHQFKRAGGLSARRPGER
jgi:hypothetical protein